MADAEGGGGDVDVAGEELLHCEVSTMFNGAPDKVPLLTELPAEILRSIVCTAIITLQILLHV